MNGAAKSGSYMVPRERQREEIGSDYYYGGMVVERSANMHPALYYKGLLEAARRRGVTICSMTPVKSITRSGSGWSLKTARGAVVAGDVVKAGVALRLLTPMNQHKRSFVRRLPDDGPLVRR